MAWRLVWRAPPQAPRCRRISLPGIHVNIDQHEMLVSALLISANFASAFYESLGDRLYRKL